MDEIPNFFMQLLSPIAVVLVGWWMRSQLRKVDEISKILVEMQYLKERQTEIKIELEKLNKFREDFILTKNEVKTQWRRIDEINKRIKEKIL